MQDTAKHYCRKIWRQIMSDDTEENEDDEPDVQDEVMIAVTEIDDIETEYTENEEG